MVAAVAAELGAIDVLYHTAVDVRFVNYEDRRLTELPDEVWERMIRLCLTGTFNVCKHVGRQMLAQRSGSIVLSATTDALIGVAGLDSYTAAKGGVVALTRSFAAGMAPDGVRVNALCPAFVATEPQRAWLEDPASRAAIQSLHLLPIPEPEDIAPFAVFLASDESRAVTGGVFPVDAGYMAFKANVDVMGAMQARRDET
jgi:NAD(P)-dependent dehydrogenase (short-subunit alcohol dehydrogenase family)